MATITANQVKELRDLTGAGMMDCKRALEESGGDMERAVALLRERGIAAAAKRSERAVHEGVIGSYVHVGGKIGVLVEVNCETDFVARTDEFQALARNLAMQVAGFRPLYLTVDSIPSADLEAKRAEFMAEPDVQKKPEHIRPQIIEGKLPKWFAEVVLYEQPYRDEDRSVGQLVTEAVQRTGENIQVRRFVRYELGEEA